MLNIFFSPIFFIRLNCFYTQKLKVIKKVYRTFIKKLKSLLIFKLNGVYDEGLKNIGMSRASLALAYLTRSQTVNPVNCVLLLLWRQEEVYRSGIGSNIRVGDKSCAMDLGNIAPYLGLECKIPRKRPAIYQDVL